MRLAPVLTIAKKELREIARDRRTLLLMIGLPVLVYPLMMIGMSKLQETQSEAQEARRSIVAVWGAVPGSLDAELRADTQVEVKSDLGLPDTLRAALQAGTVTPAPAISPPEDNERPTTARNRRQARAWREADNPVLAAARSVVTGRLADAVVVAWPGLDRAAGAEGAGQLTVYFDSVREESATALDRLDRALEAYRTRAVAGRIDARDLPRGFASVFELLRRDVAPPSRQAGRILGSFLPFLLISLSLFGGFYPAVDLTAGEKERGTLQTLLCAPLRPIEIVTGKFLAVWAVALGTALVNVFSLGLTVARLLGSADMSVPVSAYALTAAMLVPVTLTTAALFIAVAVFARDFKDGQNFLTPVYMLLVIPAGATMLPGVELNAWTAFVPIVNIALLVKALLIGEWRGNLVFLSLLSSAAFAVVAMLLAVRVFEREQVLLGGRESARSLLGLERRNGGRPSPALAVTMFAIVLVLAFYGSLLLEKRGLLVQLLATQYVFFLAPALLVVLGLGFSPAMTFRWRLPHWHGALGAVLIGVGAWTVVSAVVVLLAPPPDSLVKALGRLLMLGDRPMPLWVILLAVAVTPAFCEELFFRGLVMSGLAGLGRVAAISVSALLFAVAHASIYRLLPTLLLGLVLGYVAWKTGSILCSMIVHALNNGVAATLTVVPALARATGLDQGRSIPPRLLLLGAVVTALGLWMVARLPHPPDERVPRGSTIQP
jgi:sodium transport system permease protein